MAKIVTQSEILSRFKLIHGTKYDYSEMVYVKRAAKIKVICRRHGAFITTPHEHLKGHGCTKCYRERCSSTKGEFVSKAKAVHGSTYMYRKVRYTRNHTPVLVTCRTHGDFSISPANHLTGYGCPKCRDDRKRTTLAEFIEKAREVFGDKYGYKKVVYVNCRAKVCITCPEHGDFLQIPSGHLRGKGCKGCSAPRGYSNLAIAWIEGYAYTHRLKNIRHAQKGGEVRLPGTTITVDGYHEASNTVFEFHGDIWHGNPDVCSPRSHPNPYSSLTASQLYKRTLARDAEIRRLGYRLVVIWENDYVNQ